MSKGQVYEYNGLKLTLTQWADRLGISKMTMAKRLKQHGPGPEAMSEQKLKRGPPFRQFVLYDELWTAEQMLEVFGISRNRVSIWRMSEEGIEAKLEKWKERNAKKLEAKEFPKARG